MAERTATAEWKGGVLDGEGRMALGSGAYEGKFSFATRMGDEPGTNPEEMIGAALAGCFSMALNAALEKQGNKPNRVRSEAKVFLGKDDSGFVITHIDLETAVDVDGLENDEFQKVAETAKKNCPVGKALSAVPINLKAGLAKS